MNRFVRFIPLGALGSLSATAIILSSCQAPLGVVGNGSLTSTTAFGGVTGATILSPTSIKLSWNVSSTYSQYQIFASSSPIALASTIFSSFTLTGMQPATAYTFSVGGVLQGATQATDGLNVPITATMWPQFTGAASLTATSPTSLIAAWTYPVQGPTFNVYIAQGVAGNPTLPPTFNFTTPVATTNGTTAAITALANGTALTPSTQYWVVVRATYLDQTSESNLNMQNTTTQSAFTLIPTVVSDPVLIGSLPTFTLSGGAPNQTVTLTNITGGRNIQLGTMTGAATAPKNTFTIPSSDALPPGANTITATVTDNKGNSLALPNISIYSRQLPATMTDFPTASGGKGAQELGYATATGDFNCDGYTDLAISAPFGAFDAFQMSGPWVEGGVYVLFGTNAGLCLPGMDQHACVSYITAGSAVVPAPSTNPTNSVFPLLITPVSAYAPGTAGFNWGFGQTLAAGNLNGDTNPNIGSFPQCDDLAVGIDQSGGPAAFVFFGSPGGIQTGQAVVNSAPCDASRCNPLIISPNAAPVSTYGAVTAASAFGDHGTIKANGVNTALYGIGTPITFGRFHDPANDVTVNGGVVMDLAIGDPSDIGASGAEGCTAAFAGTSGSVSIYYGSPTVGTIFNSTTPTIAGNPPVSPAKLCASDVSGAVNAKYPRSFGYSVGAVDTDGDGIDDIVVGAPQDFAYGGGAANEGAVYVYRSAKSTGGTTALTTPNINYGAPANGIATGYYKLPLPVANSSNGGSNVCPATASADNSANNVNNGATGNLVRLTSPTWPNKAWLFGKGVANGGNIIGRPSNATCNPGGGSINGGNPCNYRDLIIASAGWASGVPAEFYVYYGGATGVQTTSFKSNGGSTSAINPTVPGGFLNATSSCTNGTLSCSVFAVPYSPNQYAGSTNLYDMSLGGSPLAIEGTTLQLNDANNDGYSDIAVGWTSWIGGNASLTFPYIRGAVYEGSATGLQPTPQWLTPSTDGRDTLGYSIALGRFHGKLSPSDVTITAPDARKTTGSTGNGILGGIAYAFFGSTTFSSSNTPSQIIAINNSKEMLEQANTTIQAQQYAVPVGNINGANPDGGYYGDAIIKVAYPYSEGASFGTDYNAATFGIESELIEVFGSASGLILTGTTYNGQVVPAASYSPANALYPTLIQSVQNPQLTATGASSYKWVFPAGDVNGDSFMDVAAIAYVYDANSNAYQYDLVIYYGTQNGLNAGTTYPAPPSSIVTPTNASQPGGLWFNPEIVAIEQAIENTALNGGEAGPNWMAFGDYNHDGFGDLAFGCYGGCTGGVNGSNVPQGTGLPSSDRVIVIYGSSNGPQTDGILAMPLNNVSAAGPQINLNTTTASSYVVAVGSPSMPCNLAIPPVCKAQVLQAGSSVTGINFGRAVATAGDVNNDGFQDLVVGANIDNTLNPGHNPGAAYLFFGSQQGLIIGGVAGNSNSSLFPAITGMQIYPPYVDSANGGAATYQGNNVRYAGSSVGGVGDVNGDSYGDFVVGSLYDRSQNVQAGYDTGGAFIYYGCSNGLNNTSVSTGCSASGIYGFGPNNTFKGSYVGTTLGVPSPYAPANTNGSCVAGGTCKPMFFGPSTTNGAASTLYSTTAYQMRYFSYVIGTAGQVNPYPGGSYSSVIAGTYSFPIDAVPNTTAAAFNGGMAILYTGSPTGLYVGGTVSQNPTCIGGTCTPYIIFPSHYAASNPVATTWGKTTASYTNFTFNSMFPMIPGGSDFNGDGFADFFLNSAAFMNQGQTQIDINVNGVGTYIFQ